MGRNDYAFCRSCGKSAKDAGPMSHTRLCQACALDRASTNLLSLIEHRGPEFAYWRQRLAASVGAPLLDDPTKAP